MKKVLLIGDSIRLNYQEKVRELLADTCEVVYPNGNCEFTLNTLWSIRQWFRDYDWGRVDLIHWNTGIWDHHRNADDGEPLSTPEQYLYYNRRLHKQLATYTKNLIWATTTPAGPHYKPDPDWLCPLSREDWNEEVSLYNDILRAYLVHQGVAIDDLYELVQHHWDYLTDDGIHLSPAGVEGLGRQVADCIRAHLG